jgi:hypothetical protein
VADAGIGEYAQPREDDVVVDVRVVGRGVPVAVGQDILGGHRSLLLGDVEYRFLPVGVADNEHPLVVAGLHGVRDPVGAGEVRNGRDRARRDDDVVRLEGPVADCQPVVVDERGRFPEELDVLAVGKPLGDRDARAPVCAHDRDVRTHARTPPSTRVPGALQARLIAPPRGTRLRPRGRWSSARR